MFYVLIAKTVESCKEFVFLVVQQVYVSLICLLLDRMSWHHGQNMNVVVVIESQQDKIIARQPTCSSRLYFDLIRRNIP